MNALSIILIISMGGGALMSIDLSKPWAGKVPLHTVIRNPDQPRQRFPKQEIERVGKSMRKHGQTTPCTVIPVPKRLRTNGAEWLLVDGECRYRGAQHEQIDELLVCYNPQTNEDNLHLSSLAANFCRLPHTKQEIARAVAKEREAGRTYEEIGGCVGKTAAWAEQYHNLLKLHPTLQKYLDEPDPACYRKLSTTVAQLLVSHDQEKQLRLWQRFRHMENREMYHKVRTTGVVGAKRNPTDDFTYASSALKQALGNLKRFCSCGEVMMRRFSAERLEELRKIARAVHDESLAADAWLQTFDGRVEDA